MTPPKPVSMNEAGGGPAAGRPDWGLRVAALIVLAILISLGVWQLQRLAWKTALLEDLAARQAQTPITLTPSMLDTTPGAGWAAQGVDAIRFTPVTLSGRYEHHNQIGVPVTKEGLAGWRLVTPLRLESVSGPPAIVFVDRGFIARTPDTVATPPASPAGLGPRVSVAGLVRPKAGDSAFTPAPDSARRISYSLAPAVLSDTLGLGGQTRVAPFVVSATSETPAPRGAGLTPNPPTIDAISNRHLEYALTWFALAGALIAVVVAHQTRRRRAAPLP